MRFDYQQGFGNEGVEYIKLNQTFHNMQPRVGVIWDFTGKSRGKFFANYAKYLETPIPLDLNVRAGSENSQTDKNFNMDRVNAPNGSNIVPGIRSNLTIGAVNLGATPTPIDPGLRPQTVHEITAGFEYEIARNLTIGARGIYHWQGDVIEDGSFDDGDTYFLSIRAADMQALRKRLLAATRLLGALVAPAVITVRWSSRPRSASPTTGACSLFRARLISAYWIVDFLKASDDRRPNLRKSGKEFIFSDAFAPRIKIRGHE